MAEFDRHQIYLLLNESKPLWLAGIDLSGANLIGANLSLRQRQRVIIVRGSVIRLQLAADEQHAGRIVNFPKRARVDRVGFGENVDPMLAAEAHDVAIHLRPVLPFRSRQQGLAVE